MACAVRPTNIGNGLAKLDIQTGDVKTWHMPGAITGDHHKSCCKNITITIIQMTGRQATALTLLQQLASAGERQPSPICTALLCGPLLQGWQMQTSSHTGSCDKARSISPLYCACSRLYTSGGG
jgi:hypothetical protein